MNTLIWLVAQNAVTVLVALPVVWLLARLRSCRPAEQHLLWLLLLIKLVTPPVIVWPLSLEEVSRALAPREHVPTASISADGGVLPPLDEPNLMSAVRPPAISPAAPIIHAPIRRAAFSWWALLGWLTATGWVLGTAAVLGITFRQMERQRRLVRAATEAPEKLDQLVRRVASRLGIRPVQVRLSQAVASPCVSCLGRPLLIWPASAKDAKSLPCAEAIVVHELAHLRRLDHWVSWLELFVLTLWWWNPCFWLVRWQLHVARELACDAVALEFSATDRREFAELLLGLSDAGNSAFGPASLVGAGLTSRYSLRRRLEMVFNQRVSGRTSWAGFVLAGLVAIGALPGWSWGQPAPPKPASPPVDPAAAQEAAAPPAIGNKAIDRDALAVDPSGNVLVRKENDDVVQVIPLSDTHIKLQVRRDKNGVLILEIENEGRKSQTILSIAQPPGGAQYAPANTAAVRRERRDVKSRPSPNAAQPAGRALNDTADESSLSLTSKPKPAMKTLSLPLGERYATDDFARQEVELAQITLQEKMLELEAAREESAKSSDSASQRKVKLAELALKRAQIELDRAKTRPQAGSDNRLDRGQ